MSRTRIIKPSKQGSVALAPQVIERIDLDEDYSDVSGDPGGEFSLDNEDRNRHYVFAHNSPEDISQFKRDVCGYHVEQYLEGGVCPRGARGLIEVGEAITVRDHVLMSCDKAKWEKRQRYLNHKTTIDNERAARARQADVNLQADRGAARREREQFSQSQ